MVVEVNCKEDRHYDVQTGILYGVILLFGLIFLFFGYRLFKLVLFLAGFLAGFLSVYIVCNFYMDDMLKKDLPQKPQIYLGISCGGGIFLGFLTVQSLFLGLLVLGAVTGWFLPMAFLPMIIYISHYVASHFWVVHAILSPFALTGATTILLHKKQKIIITLYTSYLGAYSVIHSMYYFVEKEKVLFSVLETLYNKEIIHIDICWYILLIPAWIPLLCVFGAVVQLKVTSKNYNHQRGYGRQGRYIRRMRRWLRIICRVFRTDEEENEEEDEEDDEDEEEDDEDEEEEDEEDEDEEDDDEDDEEQDDEEGEQGCAKCIQLKSLVCYRGQGRSRGRTSRRTRRRPRGLHSGRVCPLQMLEYAQRCAQENEEEFEEGCTMEDEERCAERDQEEDEEGCVQEDEEEGEEGCVQEGCAQEDQENGEEGCAQEDQENGEEGRAQEDQEEGGYALVNEQENKELDKEENEEYEQVCPQGSMGKRRKRSMNRGMRKRIIRRMQRMRRRRMKRNKVSP